MHGVTVRITQVHRIRTASFRTHEDFEAGVQFAGDEDSSRLVIPSHLNCVTFISYHPKYVCEALGVFSFHLRLYSSNCLLIQICILALE